MGDPRFRSLIAVLGLDIRDAHAFFGMLLESSDTNEVEINAFIEGCLRMKGTATGIDLHTMIKELRMVKKQQEEFFETSESKLEDIQCKIAEFQAFDDAEYSGALARSSTASASTASSTC